jgi:nucleoside-diphosphate-sugar epimerase
MTKTALIIGGAGQIGLATSAHLAAAGWRVTIAQRRPAAPPPGGASLVLDRSEPGALARAVGRGYDAVIDTVAYEEGHGAQLAEIAGDVGAFVVISSASVYRDAAGRTLDEARQTGFPEFPVPIGEDHPTTPPGPATYSTRKVALELKLLDSVTRPLTILRPCAIYGPGSTQPREWFFIKRILDGRRAVPLAWSGASRFHTSATANIAALIAAVLERPGPPILNIADPEALSVTEIGDAIAEAHGAALEIVPMDGPPLGRVGGNPWGVPRPMIVDVSRAAATGYKPVTTYREAMAETCLSIAAAAKAGTAFPPYILDLFDYAAEDAWLAMRGLADVTPTS